MKYVILLLNTEASQQLSKAEGRPGTARSGPGTRKNGGSGKLVETGYPLAPRALRPGRCGPAASPTGDFMETKEALGGYSVLDTDTIEEAVEIARTWPGVDRGWMTVEVRPVIEM